MTDTIINIENVWIAGSEEVVVDLDREEAGHLFDTISKLEEEIAGLEEELAERGDETGALRYDLDTERAAAKAWEEAAEVAQISHDNAIRERDKLRQEVKRAIDQRDKFYAESETWRKETAKLTDALIEAKEYAARNYEHSYAVDKDGSPKLGSVWKAGQAGQGGSTWIYVGSGQYLSRYDAAPFTEGLATLTVDFLQPLIPHPDYYGPDAKVEGE